MQHPAAPQRVTPIGLDSAHEPTGIAPCTSGIATFLTAAGPDVHGGARRVRFVLLGNCGRRAHLQASGAGVRSLQLLDPLPDDRFSAALAAADVLLLDDEATPRRPARILPRTFGRAATRPPTPPRPSLPLEGALHD